jgi:hypothetical protein
LPYKISRRRSFAKDSMWKAYLAAAEGPDIQAAFRCTNPHCTQLTLPIKHQVGGIEKLCIDFESKVEV